LTARWLQYCAGSYERLERDPLAAWPLDTKEDPAIVLSGQEASSSRQNIGAFGSDLGARLGLAQGKGLGGEADAVQFGSEERPDRERDLLRH
jgi:hypothetical protein